MSVIKSLNEGGLLMNPSLSKVKQLVTDKSLMTFTEP